MTLFAFERRLTITVLKAVMPPVNGVVFPPARTARFLADYHRGAPLAARLALRAAVLLAWLVPLLSRPRRTLLGLSPPARDQALQRLFHSRFYLVRQLCQVLKMVAALGHLGNMATQVALGYRGPHLPPLGRRAGGQVPSRDAAHDDNASPAGTALAAAAVAPEAEVTP
ncbi:MAG: hypothetical protein HY719_02955 [Planctomycetes bacterium]|nr:hypothetical protein [Planctomycetota bacterium]